MQESGSHQANNSSHTVFMITGFIVVLLMIFFAVKGSSLFDRIDIIEDVEALIHKRVNNIVYEVEHIRNDIDNAVKAKDIEYIKEYREYVISIQKEPNEISKLEEASRLDTAKLSNDIATYQQNADDFVDSMLHKKNSDTTHLFSTNILLLWQQLEADLNNFYDFSHNHLS